MSVISTKFQEQNRKRLTAKFAGKLTIALAEPADPTQSRNGQFRSQQTINITIRVDDAGANKRIVWIICVAGTTLKQIISLMLIFSHPNRLFSLLLRLFSPTTTTTRPMHTIRTSSWDGFRAF